MANETNAYGPPHADPAAGFSLAEMLISVVIITLLMSAVFSFIFQTQKRFQSNQVTSESNQSARAAMEVLTQEIGQAGRNPNFFANKTMTSSTTASGLSQCVTLYDSTGTTPDISRISAGDWLSVDVGADNDLTMVSATSTTPSLPAGYCATIPIPRTCPCPVANQVRLILQSPHTVQAGPPVVNVPVMSYKFPYATGILTGTVNGVTATSNDHTLEFYGDINDDGVVNYVVYSLSPTTTPATTVCIPAASPCPAANLYTLYSLYRSITPVTFPAGASQFTNKAASALVQNVLYQDITAAYTAPVTAVGPTGQPIFGYPQTFNVGIIPNQVTVVGTILITISVAVNPQSLESGVVEWYTMASQIRPLNLAAAITVNQEGGSEYMAKPPLDLPMQNPAGYYQ